MQSKWVVGVVVLGLGVSALGVVRRGAGVARPLAVASQAPIALEAARTGVPVAPVPAPPQGTARILPLAAVAPPASKAPLPSTVEEILKAAPKDAIVPPVIHVEVTAAPGGTFSLAPLTPPATGPAVVVQPAPGGVFTSEPLVPRVIDLGTVKPAPPE